MRARGTDVSDDAHVAALRTAVDAVNRAVADAIRAGLKVDAVVSSATWLPATGHVPQLSLTVCRPVGLTHIPSDKMLPPTTYALLPHRNIPLG